MVEGERDGTPGTRPPLYVSRLLHLPYTQPYLSRISPLSGITTTVVSLQRKEPGEYLQPMQSIIIEREVIALLHDN